MSVRTIHITDEQLKLIAKAIGHATPGSLPAVWSPEELHELDVLVAMIQNTVIMPDDPNLLHGFCL